jgi:two-component system, NtrC family, sensor kinase
MNQVLVIDDDLALRLVVRASLSAKGYQVAEAASGAEGIHLARSLRPDLILCDLYMADVDGYSVLRDLLEEPGTASISLIIMTGRGDLSEVRRGMELGADDFLLKPFTEESLYAAVSARLKRREAMRQKAAHIYSRLVAILDATPDLVAILDAAYDRVIYLNQAGRAILGCQEPEDLENLTSARIHPPEALEALRQTALPAVLESGLWAAETTLCGRAGKCFPVSQLILVQKDDDGRPDCLAMLARDISAEKAARKEHDVLEVQLRQAQKLESIGQLAAGIAHEINTPTQYIGDNIRFLQTAFQDFARLLARYEVLLETRPQNVSSLAAQAKKDLDLEYLAEEVPKAIQQSQDGVERVTKIVRAMKDFSHPGASSKTPTDINRAIDSTLTVARNEWKYVATLETDFDAALPPVPCLPGEFNQVILNLVINAAHAIVDVVGTDAAKGKGVLSVSTRRAGEWAEIRIRDTGSGIPDKIKDKIFDPFFTTKPVGKGTGQGLAIARSVVVDKHGGAIEFETLAGQGTTFIVRLPLQANKSKLERKP